MNETAANRPSRSNRLRWKFCQDNFPSIRRQNHGDGETPSREDIPSVIILQTADLPAIDLNT